MKENTKDTNKENKDAKTKKFSWSRFKKKFLDIVKFTLFTIVLLMGFWAIYAVGWYALGFPGNHTAMVMLLLQAIISELLFIKWFMK